MNVSSCHREDGGNVVVSVVGVVVGDERILRGKVKR